MSALFAVLATRALDASKAARDAQPSVPRARDERPAPPTPAPARRRAIRRLHRGVPAG